MEAIQEKSLQHTAAETLLVTEKRTPFAELDAEVKLAIECAGEKKAFDIVALNLREIASFAEFFVICTGANQRQVQAICDEIQEQLKKQLKSASHPHRRLQHGGLGFDGLRRFYRSRF